MAVLESSYHGEENSERSTPNKMDPRRSNGVCFATLKNGTIELIAGWQVGDAYHRSTYRVFQLRCEALSVWGEEGHAVLPSPQNQKGDS